MKVSLNWLKEFVDLDGITPEEIVHRFNLTTAEIEHVEYKGADTEKVVFAKVLSVAKHPLSEKLHILKVNDGSIEPVQVVCGAPNVREGMITAFAQIGAKVSGHKISKAKLAGEESFGMCCSEAELGIGSDDNGIMDITDNVTIGADIKSFYPIDDVVFEIDNKSLTNRPDLWGHYGLAREIACMFHKKLKDLKVVDLNKYKANKELNISIESKNCFRYSSIAVENIAVKKSPVFMKIRLCYCGMRDINLLADITNYLMLEVGQPMHAFDYAKVDGITVVDAKPGMELLTLEGEKHEIPAGAIVVCDRKKQPVAIAGIKGGMAASISDTTNSLLLESAVFDATSIRKASINIGLRTDSSIRYEKSLDPENTVVAIARVIYLLSSIDKGMKVISRLTDVYNHKYPKIEISTSVDFIESRIGQKIGEARIINILESLNFDVKNKNGILKVKVPSFRATKDVSIKEDLVEEVARVYGYDNIEPKTVDVTLEPKTQSREHVLEYAVKRLLCDKFGASEVHSYIWNYEDFNKEVGIDSKSYVRLVDSTNSGQSGIRSELLPTMIKFFHENKNSYDDIRIFEIGRVCSGLSEGKHAVEEKKLAILFASKTATDEELYFRMKSVIQSVGEVLLHNTGIKFVEAKTRNFMHPVNSCAIVYDEEKIGEMGVLNPVVVKNIDKAFKVSILELNFSMLSSIPEIEQKAKPVSKYQSVNLDFNFLIPNNKKYVDVDNVIKVFKPKLNFEIVLKDIYENESLGDFYSLTFNVTISSNEKTLSGEDIDKFSNRFIEHMKQNGYNLK